MGPINYEVVQLGHQPGKQIYHINLLKQWHMHDRWLYPDPAELGPCLEDVSTPGRLVLGKQLTQVQEQLLQELVAEYWGVFCTEPGAAKGVVHYINTQKGSII